MKQNPTNEDQVILTLRGKINNENNSKTDASLFSQSPSEKEKENKNQIQRSNNYTQLNSVENLRKSRNLVLQSHVSAITRVGG